MDEKKKATALRLVTINSDESRVPRATRTVALLHPDQTRYLDGVEAVVRMLEPDEIKRIEEKHRLPHRSAKGIEWKVDTEALVLELLVTAVESWKGILGADHKPMRVCPAALQALDPLNKSHLASVAKLPAEVVDAEVVDESFREPAGVAGVAG